MSAGLLKPSVDDEDTTYTKLRLHQQQQTCYYNRGAHDLDPLEKSDAVRVQPWQVGKKGVVKNCLSERSYKVEPSQGVLCRNRIHLRKTKEPAATTDDTQCEQCNEPQPQESVEPVAETNELPSQSAVEVPTEVPLPATPVKATEPRRSQRIRRVPTHLEDYVLT